MVNEHFNEAALRVSAAAMNEVSYLHHPEGHQLAYRLRDGNGPTVVFLSGFRSDMGGNKARHLSQFCASREQGYMCFDYRGHGASAGCFEESCISDWIDDAWLVISRVVAGPILLIGSSMGGWIGLRVAERLRERGEGSLAGFVGIAPAPDFTELSLPARLGPGLVAEAMRNGVVYIESKYGDGPYPITRRLLEDGKHNTVLTRPLHLDCPVRLLHGELDQDVPWQRSQQLLAHMQCQDASLLLIKDGDHRLSEPQHLRELERTVAEISVIWGA
jgi:pimeloyl-ACP methyl ester carboxylesterase